MTTFADMDVPPVPGGTLVSAVDWVASLLTGSAATSLMILAIAGAGGTMLAGRLPMRRGASIVLACFVIFGAARIAGGLGDDVPPSPRSLPPASIAPFPNGEATPGYDPYAGAAMPAGYAAGPDGEIRQ